MICVNDKSKCCGCTACYSICPNVAIKMQMDEEGFLYPKVEKTKCVNCGLCERVCPELNPNTKEDKHQSVQIVLQIKDNEKRYESTAGGAFTLVAEYVLQKQGTVFAAGWDDQVVCHKGVKEAALLGELRGSKYVQSTLNDTFVTIKTTLKNNGWVLFAGTPCQVHGLYRYLKENRLQLERLVLVDLLCLGVSSPGVMSTWIKYLEKKYRSNVDHVEFRNKRFGYSTTNVQVVFLNGKKLEQRYDSKVYSQSFFKGYNVRPSCYSCDFREIPRVSDFTIGDCIDIGALCKSMDDDKGTTRLWAHTEKANRILEEMCNAYRSVVLETGASRIVGGQKKQVSIPKNRKAFFEDYQALSWSELSKKYVPNNMTTMVASTARLTINSILPAGVKKKIFQKIRKYKSVVFKKQVEEANREKETKK